jgi:hypothetical protein
MKLYRKVNESGYFIEDVLLDSIPVLTETAIDETNGEEYTRNVTREVTEETGEVDENGNPVTITYQENVPDPHYIGVQCQDGFILPRWDWEGEYWKEGGTEQELSKEQQINALKKELEETDYKIIKCSEYQLIGLEMPYDIVGLHNIRQTIRDKINLLEG